MAKSKQAYQVIYDKFEDKVYAVHQYGLVDISAFLDISEYKLTNKKTGQAEITCKLSVMLESQED
jgi:hypothetical protein